MLFYILISTITGAYIGLLITFIYGWTALKASGISQDPVHGFSVIIPFRNEAEHLPQLFDALQKLEYPRDQFEIILVNDKSEDESRAIADQFKAENPGLDITILENVIRTNAPKKDAISTAIKRSKFEYIVTTDADCLIPKMWLKVFDSEISASDPELIAGPVGFQKDPIKRPMFQIFDEMDTLSLQASTAGSIGVGKAFMCNAANLCYKKQAFLLASGFEEHHHIASGDDVFLIQQLRKNGEKIAFLRSKEAIVWTKPQKSLGLLINQRIRWAAKSASYKSLYAKFVAFIIFAMNANLIIFGIMAFFKAVPYYPVMLAFLLKFNFDFILIYKAARFFDREHLMRSYFWCSLIYPFFTVFVALASMSGGYEWKGRKFSR